MSQDIDKAIELIKRFSILNNEYNELGERFQQIKVRLTEIEFELSEIRNYLYRDRSKEFILDVSAIVNTMIEEDETGEYRKTLHELKEIIDLWLRDYYHYIRYGTNNLSPLKKRS
jgi:DNA integrity scanning protein DisA with diadenylate cyclase activity